MTHSFSNYLEAIPPSGIREFFDIVSTRSDIISLGVGEPDFLTPWFIRDEAIYALEKGLTTYTSNLGLLELRQEISRYMQSLMGVTYSVENEILVTNGVSEGVDLLCRTLLNPGDEVIVPKPMYVCYDPLIALTGAQVVSCDTTSNGFIPDPDHIESLITSRTKALVLCYPQNPTGMGLSKQYLESYAKLAIKHDLWVISDEIYAQLQFEGEFHSIASCPQMNARTIVLNGVSKSHAMTGWRLGFMCAPESVISRAMKIHQYSAMSVSTISQYAAIEALKNGQKEVVKMRKSYMNRANLFSESMTACGLSTLVPEGGFYCFPSIKSTGLSSLEFAKRLLDDYQVAVVPGTAFGDEGEGYIRCCFATKLSELMVASDRIKACVKELG